MFARLPFSSFWYMMNVKPYFSSNISLANTREENLMRGHELNVESLEQFKQHLISGEKSAATVEKYLRDAAAFLRFVQDAEITKG